ncbi:hypothetical protein [Actinoplanes sp. DH11]|uniref:hypothetical protein n=1 Tax=Actinoplanes sp. DH11 TaxID=2857011 RepID=UPI001E373860|nr:hypothetical protein [Actinoplanes sp. DH11]
MRFLGNPRVYGTAIGLGVAVLGNVVASTVDAEWAKRWWWLLTVLLLLLAFLPVLGLRFWRRARNVARIAACSPGSGKLYLFGVTAEGDLLSRQYREGRTWSAWTTESLPGVKARDVAAMAGTRDALELYVVCRDGSVRTRRLDHDGSWSRWEKLSSSSWFGDVVAVAAISGSPGWRELYAVGSSGQVAHRWAADDKPWSAWHPGHHQGARDVAITSPVPHTLESFVVNRDGEIWHRWYVEQNWSDWESLGRPADGSPARSIAATGFQREHQELFVAGTEGDVAHRWHWQATGWADPWHVDSPPEKAVDIAAASTSQGRLHVTAVDENGVLWQHVYRSEPREWSAWERIG